MARVNHTAVAMLYTNFRYEVMQYFKTDLPHEVLAALDKMKDDVDLLLKSWSIMAGRNLMADLMRLVMLFEPNLQGKAKEAAVTFKNALARRLEKHNPGKARYDSVLCIGYRAKTAGGNAFSGATDDYKDMRAKCDDMIDAIRKAHGAVDATYKSDDRMLKIFMAPEFFFRGQNGGYAADDVEPMVLDQRADKDKKGLMQVMKEVVDEDIFKDWLFVLGTVIVITKETSWSCSAPGCTLGVQFEKQPDNTTRPVCKADRTHAVAESGGKATVDNVAYICKEKFVYTVSKELVSGIDFITDRNLGIRDQVTVKGEALQVARHPIKDNYYTAAAAQKPNAITDERMGGTIFTMDGITFACEVCLDHAASAVSEGQGRGKDHAGDIQIQLIPSAGMSIGQFRTVPKGVVFNVDGGTPHVQVVGMTTAGSKLTGKIKAIQSYPGARQTATHGSDWNEKEMAAELDILEAGKANANWVKGSDQVAAKGGRGAVVQFGPFEIPSL